MTCKYFYCYCIYICVKNIAIFYVGYDWKVVNPKDNFTKSRKLFLCSIFTLPKESHKCHWRCLAVGSVFCTRSRKELQLYVKCNFWNVARDIAFKNFHFLTLWDKFYYGLLAWSFQPNFTSCHWWSIMAILNSFHDRFGQ